MCGHLTGVAVRIAAGHGPRVLRVHCIAHRTSLCMHALDDNALVAKLSAVMHAVYNFFAGSKRALVLKECQAQVRVPFHQLLQDIVTRCATKIASGGACMWAWARGRGEGTEGDDVS